MTTIVNTTGNSTIFGKVPQFDPDRGWRQWHINELYTGPDGSGDMVPNIQDAVLDWDYGWFRVIDVDYTTGLSTLVAWTRPGTGGVPEEDILLGVGPGRASETFRLFIDTSVVPHRICADSRLHLYGESNLHYKVFLGTDITSNGAKVISAYYDQNGDWVSENIPMELVGRQDVNNISIKAPAPGYTHYKLRDGDPVTLVVYNQSMVSSTNVLLAKETAFIRSSEAATRYITHIAIESPFIMPTDLDTVQVPINLTIESVVSMARVYYSDGSSRRVPIDGTKMQLAGYDKYVSTILGQRAPLVLMYKLGPGEFTMDSADGRDKHISKKYFAESMPVVNAYSMKLFVVPNWHADSSTWRLDYFLCNMDRGDLFYATPYVESSINSAPFDSSLVGQTQWITVALDVNRVDPRLSAYRHVQTFGIAILTHGLSENTAWIIQYSPGQYPEYGHNLKAVATMLNVGNWLVDISCGYLGIEQWLDALYHRVQPLFDPRTETRAPTPTHFILNLNGIRNEYPISQWNAILSSPTGGTEGRSALIEWRRKVGSDVLQLGVSPLRIIQELSNTPAPAVVNLYPGWVEASEGGGVDNFNFRNTLVFNPDGTGRNNWTFADFVWGDGDGFADETFEMKIELVDRYISADQQSYIYLLETLNTFVPMSTTSRVTVKGNGYVPNGSKATINVTIRSITNPTNMVSGQFEITKVPADM